MKCIECGSTMTKKLDDHVYRESGMDHVILRNVPHLTCPKCGTERVEIDRPAQLHRLLAEILANKQDRLIPSEVRFIRDHLGLSNRDFAAVMGVTESQASRWTTNDPMAQPAEHFLRMLATMGPFVLASSDAPKVELGKIEQGKFVADVVKTLSHLPSRDATPKSAKMSIRRTSTDWKPDAAV